MAPVIAFDVDGPLANFTGGLCAALRRRGFDRDETSIQHWDLAASLSPEESAETDTIISTPGFCSALPWIAGARSTIRRLRNELRADVVCVTSPYPSRSWIRERLAWLSPMFRHDDVLFVRTVRKHLIGCELLIEDHPGVAGAWLDAHPSKYAILLDRSWNQPTAREFWPHRRMIRATDDRVLDIAREILT